MPLTWPIARAGKVGTLGRGWKIGDKAKGKKSHLGLDVRAPVGTDVLAVDAGVVVATSSSEKGGCGVYVEHVTDRGAKWWSEGLHLSAFYVERGDVVRAGQPLARSGNTGSASTGPHLHEQFRVSGGWLRAHAAELGLRAGRDYVSVRTKAGATLYYVDPLVLLEAPAGGAGRAELDELEPSTAAGLSLEGLARGLAALGADEPAWLLEKKKGKPKKDRPPPRPRPPGKPSPLRIKAWCTWQGQRAAIDLIAAAAFVAVGFGLISLGGRS